MARKDIGNKLMIFGSDRKKTGKILPFGNRKKTAKFWCLAEKESCLKRIKAYDIGEERVGNGQAFAR